MAHTPGEIYFVRETVLGTDELSPFVKIGLVAKERASAERLKEHQTGNPRRLFNQAVIKTDAVHRVEALMHRLFATHRVSGEWFKFETDGDLQSAISKAQELSNEMASYMPVFRKAEELGQVASIDGKILSPSNDIMQAVQNYRESSLEVAMCDERISLIGTKFREALDSGVDLQDVAKEKTISPVPKFNVTIFKKNHKETYDAFVIKNPTWAAKFSWLPLSLEPSDLSEEFFTEMLDIEAAIDEVGSVDDAYKLNEPLLRLTKLKALSEWKFDLAEAQIKVFCDDAEGIEGVCTWDRKASTRAKFDEGKFAQEMPDLWLEYTLPREAYTRLTVARRQS